MLPDELIADTQQSFVGGAWCLLGPFVYIQQSRASKKNVGRRSPGGMVPEIVDC